MIRLRSVSGRLRHNALRLLRQAVPHSGLQGRLPLAVLLPAAALLACWAGLRTAAAPTVDVFAGETIETMVRSEFSEIVVTRQGDIRSLWFLHDDGDHGLESQQDLREPHRLLLPYSQCMFTSYLLRPKPEQVLMVGLGGGSMVHFLEHYDPNLRVDVVEIDPVVVKLAEEYFGVRTAGKVKIVVDDAFKYLRTTDQRYDVIYMDAFLKPSGETDTSGVPQRLKTIEFLKDVQKKLKPDGLVVFNVHVYPDTPETLSIIRAAFQQVYVVEVSHRGSMAVIGSTAKQRVSDADLREKAKELDERFKADFSFQSVLDGLLPPEAPKAEQPPATEPQPQPATP
jgi:spermidine synthase